jgi:hypothetical protein
MNPWITNFLLLVISGNESRIGAWEASQLVCPRFISVVHGGKSERSLPLRENAFITGPHLPWFGRKAASNFGLLSKHQLFSC